MTEKKPNAARTLIQSLGGPTKVAEMLGYDKTTGGVQRVANWQKRGIPPAVLLEFPHIFGPIPAARHGDARTTFMEARHG